MGYAPPSAPGIKDAPLSLRDRVCVLLFLALFLAIAIPIAGGLALFAYGIAY